LTRELYIYWRVSPAEVQAAVAAAAHMQRALRQRHPGLQARLLLRNEAHTKLQAAPTLMEIYACQQAGGIDPSLQADIENAAAVLARYVSPASDGPGRRHTEVFEACLESAGFAPPAPTAA
jgi:hypothetical protein